MINKSQKLLAKRVGMRAASACARTRPSSSRLGLWQEFYSAGSCCCGQPAQRGPVFHWSRRNLGHYGPIWESPGPTAVVRPLHGNSGATAPQLVHCVAMATEPYCSFRAAPPVEAFRRWPCPKEQHDLHLRGERQIFGVGSARHLGRS